MFQTKVVEKIKTHVFMFSNVFSENHAVYGIMWKNMVEPDSPDDNTAHARCMLDIGYKHTMRIYDTRCFSTCMF
jgi:hypothetical protein